MLDEPSVTGGHWKFALFGKLILFGAQDPRNPDLQPAERHKFPSAVSQLKNLMYLDLGRNGLEEIPSFVKDLRRIRELRFQWNMKLKEVPAFISNLRELTTLKLDADGLDDLPDFLNALPALARIASGTTAKRCQNERFEKKIPKSRF